MRVDNGMLRYIPTCFLDKNTTPAQIYSQLAKYTSMKEIIFLVEGAPEGGFTAKSLGYSIYTDADTIAELHVNVRDAVSCHFELAEKPSIIRLHFVHDEVISA